MPKPTPDTSPQNVARVLREVLAELDAMNAYNAERTGEVIDYTPAECEGNALADALERQAGVPWKERVERGERELRYQREVGIKTDVHSILLAAFPEYYAPTERGSDAD